MADITFSSVTLRQKEGQFKHKTSTSYVPWSIQEQSVNGYFEASVQPKFTSYNWKLFWHLQLYFKGPGKYKENPGKTVLVGQRQTIMLIHIL